MGDLFVFILPRVIYNIFFFTESILLAFSIEMGIHLIGRVIPSYFCWSQRMAPSWLILCLASAQPVLCFLACDAEAGPAQHHVKVQAVDANTWVVFNPQVDVLLDPQTKVSSVWGVIFFPTHTPIPSDLSLGPLPRTQGPSSGQRSSYSSRCRRTWLGTWLFIYNTICRS